MQHRAGPVQKTIQSSALVRALEGQDTIESGSPIVAGLNPAQRTAVTTTSKIVQILAPPGSGKTRTLTSRVAYLLTEPPYLAPQNVIVATFTVKAANEMKQRLTSLVGEEVGKRLILGTFHSICRRYLLRYGHFIGLKQGWGIADSGDSKAICNRIIKRRGLTDTIDARQLLSRISHFKARNISPQADKYTAKQFTSPSNQEIRKKPSNIATDDFVALYEDYNATLESSNLLDYDDLLLRCLELIKGRPECVSNIEAVLIDEFQDTNIVQYELMRNFASKNNTITVVGDPDQSIYGFRAAEIGNVRAMQRQYPDTLVVKLEENYRSSASIVHAALVVIQQDNNRIEKALTATHPIGPSPVLRRVPTASSEAAWIVGEIQRLRAITAGMVSLDGIAILVRSANLTRLIETALTRQEMPYRMVGGTRFFDRAEVKVVVDYLRVLHNPSNNDALVRVINVPSRKIGESTIKALLELAESKRKSLWETVHRAAHGDSAWGVKIAKSAERGMESFVGLILRAREKLDDKDPENNLADILEGLLAKVGYEAYIKKGYPDDFEGRWANVQELIAQAREVRFEAENDELPVINGIEQQKGPQKTPKAALEQFLANAALVNEKQRNPEDEKVSEITISTIHAAKGLEWPVVFVPAVYEGSIPHSRAEDIDEERRLLYVAMTRAQALLYLSCPFKSSFDAVKLSSFLDTPLVALLFDKKASDLQISEVQTLSQILGVQCPTQIEIEAAVAKSGLTSRIDDQIPHLNPSEDRYNNVETVDEDASYQYTRGDERYNDMPRFETARGWTAPGNAMETTESRLRRNMTTAEKIGFRTAGNHLSELQKHGKIASEADNKDPKASFGSYRKTVSSATLSSRMVPVTPAPAMDVATMDMPIKPALRGEKGTGGATKPTKRPAGQGTLMGYFSKKPPESAAPSTQSSRPKTATEVVKHTNHLPITLKEQIDSLPQPIVPKRSASEFIFLSSSPPRMAKKSKASSNTYLGKGPMEVTMDTIIERPEKDFDESQYDPPSSPAFVARNRMDESEDHFPAAEVVLPELEHDTETFADTGARIDSRPANIKNKPHRVAPRRTLGIRRSMNGWDSRARK